jgi:hypothetical protein
MGVMPILRCQLRIPHSNGVPADTCVNTWHVTAVDAEEGTLADIKAAFVAFYEALDAYKGDIMSWGSSRWRIYNLDDSEPRQPIDDVAAAVTAAPSSNNLPHELAICLSFRGELVSGAPAARRRGRIYFGPLSDDTRTVTGAVNPTFRALVATAGGTLLTTSNAASDWAWVVYSPTAGQAYPVVAGWCDDAWDVQRRRGVLATTRSTF